VSRSTLSLESDANAAHRAAKNLEAGLHAISHPVLEDDVAWGIAQAKTSWEKLKTLFDEGLTEKLDNPKPWLRKEWIEKGPPK